MTHDDDTDLKTQIKEGKVTNTKLKYTEHLTKLNTTEHNRTQQNRTELLDQVRGKLGTGQEKRST